MLLTALPTSPKQSSISSLWVTHSSNTRLTKDLDYVSSHGLHVSRTLVCPSPNLQASTSGADEAAYAGFHRHDSRKTTWVLIFTNFTSRHLLARPYFPQERIGAASSGMEHIDGVSSGAKPVDNAKRSTSNCWQVPRCMKVGMGLDRACGR